MGNHLTGLLLTPKGQAATDAANIRSSSGAAVFVARQDEGLPPTWPGAIWAMGSTFERGLRDTAVTAEAHERNARSLEAILPGAARTLRNEQMQGRLLGWSQVRCASLDRLPLVGAAPDAEALQHSMTGGRAQRPRRALADAPRWPGLYLLCAMGSRGITLAPWCAEQLAMQINREPSPVDPALLAALDPARFAIKNVRRQGSARARSTAG